jgi:hypothetical protein
MSTYCCYQPADYHQAGELDSDLNIDENAAYAIQMKGSYQWEEVQKQESKDDKPDEKAVSAPTDIEKGRTSQVTAKDDVPFILHDVDLQIPQGGSRASWDADSLQVL